MAETYFWFVIGYLSIWGLLFAGVGYLIWKLSRLEQKP